MQHTHIKRLQAPGLAALLLAGTGCAHGAGSAETATTPETAATPKEAHVEHVDDRTWITLSGQVVSAGPEAFELDYGPDVITVEMDDRDWMFEGTHLLADERVIVHGRVDDDFLEKRTIEASRVYAKGLGTEFYASANDEEDFAPFAADFDFAKPQVEVAGKVTAVKGRTFDLDTGNIVLRVDTDALRYNPLDDEGFQQIDVGDRVRVSGEMDAALFDKHDLTADWVVSLQPNPIE